MATKKEEFFADMDKGVERGTVYKAIRKWWFAFSMTCLVVGVGGIVLFGIGALFLDLVGVLDMNLYQREIGLIMLSLGVVAIAWLPGHFVWMLIFVGPPNGRN